MLLSETVPNAPTPPYNPFNMNNRSLACSLFLTLLTLPALAQSNPTASAADSTAPQASTIVRLLDRSAVWEGVRIKTEELFQDSIVGPRFKIKSDKAVRLQLVAALEGQFQVNIGDDEVRSLKRAEDLADYIFEAQNGPTMFSKDHFLGKVERLATNRKFCQEAGDCLHFIGSFAVPKGMVVTLYDQPKFKGEQLVIDASREEVRIPSFFNIDFNNNVTTTNRSVNWRENVQSLKIKHPKDE